MKLDEVLKSLKQVRSILKLVQSDLYFLRYKYCNNVYKKIINVLETFVAC